MLWGCLLAAPLPSERLFEVPATLAAKGSWDGLTWDVCEVFASDQALPSERCCPSLAGAPGSAAGSPGIAGHAQAISMPPDLAVPAAFGYQCATGTCVGSGRDSTSALSPAPAGAGWRGVLWCCACLRASRRDPACDLSALSLPSLSPCSQRNPRMAVTALRTQAGWQHRGCFIPPPPSDSLMPKELCCGKQPRLCTDTIALARLLQPPAALAGSHRGCSIPR